MITKNQGKYITNPMVNKIMYASSHYKVSDLQSIAKQLNLPVKPRESLFSLYKPKKWQKIKKTPKISDLRHFFLLESYSFYGCHQKHCSSTANICIKTACTSSWEAHRKGTPWVWQKKVKKSQNLDPCTPILPSACASAVATEL